MNPDTLVSVVVPAYKPTWFATMLDSVLAQTHPSIEVIICDDSTDTRIAEMVEDRAGAARFPIHYSRNHKRLGELYGTVKGIRMCRGEYIKLLHDDDVLAPDCIAQLAAALQRHPGAALAACRRQRIDADGTAVPDILATSFPFEGDSLVDGKQLVAFLADHAVNFIGEPSCLLARRKDLAEIDKHLMSFDGRIVPWFGDLVLQAKLLRRGDLAMLARPLVNFRVSDQQFSQAGRESPGVGNEGREQFQQALHARGWHDAGGDAGRVNVAPLDGSRAAVPVDLVQALQQAHQRAQVQWSYRDWQARRRLPAVRQSLLQAQVERFQAPPRLGVLVLPGCAGALRDTLASLAAEGGGEAALRAGLSVKVFGNEVPPDAAPPPQALQWRDDDPAGALNAALADWDVDWVILVEPATTFSRGGLTRLLLELAGAPALHAVYGDEWHRDAAGMLAPSMRPDLNLDLLLGHPAVLAGHWVFRRESVLAAGGFDAAHAGALALDLILRLIQQHGLGGIGHLAEPLVTCAPPRFDADAQRAAILRHLHARGYAGAVVESAGAGLHRIDYGHGRKPPVSLVLIAPQALAPLERCVVSLLEQTRYPDYELLLVDNGAPAEVRAWMQQVQALATGRVRAFTLDPALPHAAACNVAAGQARGEFLLFLRPEVVALQPQWLDALLNHGLRPEVGVVGARTVAADGTVSHAGLVPGLLDDGGRAFAGAAIDASGYMQRLRVAQDYSAVSDSCLLVDRALFAELGGFDADAFPDAGADIDLCLRVGARGRLVVWTPEALLLHAVAPVPLPEPARDTLCERWLPALAHDPAYSPHLRLDAQGGFRLGESDFSWKPLPWHPLPRVLAHPDDPYGSGHYRIMQPFEALASAGLVEGSYYARLLDVVDLARIDPDVLVMQRRVTEQDLVLMQRARRFSRALKIYEVDDYLPNLPLKSVHREHMPKDVLRSMRRALGGVDRFVVSTPALAEAFAGLHDDIRVARNRLDPRTWASLPASRRNAGARPRVGWAGGIGHAGDLEMIADVVRELADEVDWVFLGMCPDALRPYVAEVRPGVDFALYPRVLARLDLDLALAPLEANRFNACKSNLRLLEYGACGYPVVCSDIEAYRGDLPVTRVKPRHRDWVAAIREHLADADARAAAGDALRVAVRKDWMLAGDGLAEWRAAWLP